MGVGVGVALIFRPVGVSHCRVVGLYGSLLVVANGFGAASFFAVIGVMVRGVLLEGLAVVVVVLI